MPRAVHIGAGNIGRGFLGQLYFESGYQTTFVDVNPSVIDALHRLGEYPIRIAEAETRTVLVRHVDAIPATDSLRVARAVREAQIASIAVGVNALERLVPVLAASIEHRLLATDQPLDFIVCENLLHAEQTLRKAIRPRLPAALRADFDARIGFVEASIGRMVPIMTDEQKQAHPLLVCVEAYCELPVDAAAFRGTIPSIANLKPERNFVAYVERKLYVHNCGHATAAFLGHWLGLTYVWEAMDVPWVRVLTERAMAATCLALHRRRGLPLDELTLHAEDLRRRFGNRALNDQIARIGADPRRKLGHDDRLVGAMRMCAEQGVPYDAIALATAAAMRFFAAGDPTADEVRTLYEREGPRAVLAAFGNVAADAPISDAVAEADKRLRTAEQATSFDDLLELGS
ncbi:MAG: hypothetical protein KIS66_00370 [Fimbriimonadaceae bacterium]|nr:hypothetical protein [Fimbriimonadaceae bacterium]